MQMLAFENVCHLLIISDMYNAEKLRQRCFQYIIKVSLLYFCLTKRLNVLVSKRNHRHKWLGNCPQRPLTFSDRYSKELWQEQIRSCSRRAKSHHESFNYTKSLTRKKIQDNELTAFIVFCRSIGESFSQTYFNKSLSLCINDVYCLIPSQNVKRNANPNYYIMICSAGHLIT